jgi:hypothetical protein
MAVKSFITLGPGDQRSAPAVDGQSSQCPGGKPLSLKEKFFKKF